jgi:hypothetical protein
MVVAVVPGIGGNEIRMTATGTGMTAHTQGATGFLGGGAGGGAATARMVVVP